MPVLVPPVVPAGALSSRSQPVLTAGELVIRPWQPSDAEQVSRAYADPDIQRWHGRSMTHDEALQWIESSHERWSIEAGADWAVADELGLVGRVGLRTLDLREGAAETAYWVVPAARGRAIASRAVAAMTTWLFEELGLHRLSLLHSVQNAASCRVADKARFDLEGTLRSQVLHADGWHDMHIHARVAEAG
jgi:ribosomal-protein-alanine N-acetyltransferase